MGGGWTSSGLQICEPDKGVIRFTVFQFFFKLTVTLCNVTDMVRTRGVGYLSPPN